MAALIERISSMTLRAISSAVLNQAWRSGRRHAATARESRCREHVGDEFVAGGADEGRGGGREVRVMAVRR